MIIEKNIIINANIENCWKILGEEFNDAYKWASLINHSEGIGEKVNGSSCSERSCSTTMGLIREKLTNFSDKDYSLSYVVLKGMPFMVKSAKNNWKLNKLSNNTTNLEMSMSIELKGFMGTLMGPMMKFKMSKIGDNICEEFKYYVENGKPHPRKKK